jgi:hypothetical protein
MRAGMPECRTDFKSLASRLRSSSTSQAPAMSRSDSALISTRCWFELSMASYVRTFEDLSRLRSATTVQSCPSFFSTSPTATGPALAFPRCASAFCSAKNASKSPSFSSSEALRLTRSARPRVEVLRNTSGFVAGRQHPRLHEDNSSEEWHGGPDVGTNAPVHIMVCARMRTLQDALTMAMVRATPTLSPAAHAIL